jgi:very-short-patch-repair endonuclease
MINWESPFAGSTPSGVISLTFPLKGTICAPRKKLIIELDGSQHLKQAEYDEERTKYFEDHSYRVLRFWNNDVLNDMESVLQVIWTALKEE